jgi:hypothetical protein
LGLHLLLHVVLRVFAACLGVKEVDVHLRAVLLVFFVGEEVVDLSFVVLEVVSPTGYSNAVLMLESIVLAVVVEGALSDSIVFSGVDGRRRSLESSEVLDVIHEGLLDIWV